MKVLASFVVACLSPTIFAACGGGNGGPSSSMPLSVAPQIPVQKAYAPDRKGTSRTFNYTGVEQTFKVPAGVTRITITASGASGAPGYNSGSGNGAGGTGGLMKANIAVKPGERLAIFVGGAGGSSTSSSSGSGGFNGGGNSGTSDSCCGGGGGASDVRQGGSTLADRVVVAGGGGGGGNSDGYKDFGTGGAGGLGGAKVGTQGGNAKSYYLGTAGGGGPGTHKAGGIGGAGAGQTVASPLSRGAERFPGKGSYCYGDAGGNGQLGIGGDGGTNCDIPGGGGGGGYYGGGGGGSGAGCNYCYDRQAMPETGPYEISPSGGGGGGSGFIERPAMHVQSVQGGAAPGNGQIIISW
jgi:hypothetical protein